MTKLIKNFFIFIIFSLPLLFCFSTSELFELPKITFIYFSTTLLLGFHLTNFALGKTILFKKTPLSVFLLLFLASQIISTIFSIDPHMSFWGYYSRFNGGLLSTLCYITIYQIIAIYIDKDFTQKIIKTTLISCFFVCLYAIAQHFGIDKNIWLQDVQARVFSSFGQPNWLAAYLLICLSLLFYQIDQNPSKNNLYRQSIALSLLVIFFTSLLFTKSKSGLIAITPLFVFFFIKNIKSPKTIAPLFLLLLLPTIIFDNPIRQKILPQNNTIIDESTNNQLNITPSQDIRLIVWQGAFEIFKKFPLTGTGTETFAISYYWTRPASHNLTSEWDFLYNKAHNEFINITANTGTIGIVTYLLLIIASIISLRSAPYILIAYLTILITNFAGFSVVVTSVYFFILPLLTLNNPDSDKPPASKKLWLLIPFFLISIYFLFSTISFFVADLKYAQSKKVYQTDLSASLKNINTALALRPKEPEFLIQLADILSQAALAKNDTNLIDPTVKALSLAENVSPFHLNYLKRSAQILYNLNSLNKNYLAIGINTVKKATVLAPTDAKSFFILGQFYQADNNINSAIDAYQKAVDLKPNYDLAYFQLGQLLYILKDYTQALDNFQKVLSITPQNQDAQNYIDKIKNIGN